MRSFIISSAIIFLGLVQTSCLFIGPQVKGNGNVKEETRNVKPFNKVHVTTGMNVRFVQGDQQKVVVVADENLHEIIETFVDDGTLEIRAKANIWRAEEKKVIVTINDIEEIEATAGSNIKTESTLTAGNVRIKSSAGSNIHLDMTGNTIELSASSGSNIFFGGSYKEAELKVSSGANIKAEDLKVDKCRARASSGANIWITVNGELDAEASSGGNVFYQGSPKQVNVSSSSGGNVIKK